MAAAQPCVGQNSRNCPSPPVKRKAEVSSLGCRASIRRLDISAEEMSDHSASSRIRLGDKTFCQATTVARRASSRGVYGKRCRVPDKKPKKNTANAKPQTSSTNGRWRIENRTQPARL